MKICFDRLLPQNRLKPLYTFGPSRLVAPLGKQWVNGSTLQVRFIGGNATQHAVVKKEAAWWEEYANIKFVFNDAPDADIRISFNSNDGAWSYIGTDCASIPLNEATMNLGFLDTGTAAHEFGHALGLGHEHSNPEGGIVWNEQRVYEALAGPPNWWDKDTVTHNVLRKYKRDQIKGTQFDPKSIMLYFFPAEWTLNGISTTQNDTLSDLDKSYIGSSAMYPKPKAPINVKVLKPNHVRRTQGTIGKPGEEDLYAFEVGQGMDGGYTIDTRGETNVVMRLFGPDSLTHLVAEDDDSGCDENAKIVTQLVPGVYHVQIRHSDRTHGMGKYSVKCFYKVR